jgi:hypothetical protein
MFDMISHTLDDGLALTEAQMDRIEAVAQRLEELNEAVRKAVDSGLSVELHRAERHHCGAGCWGDVMKPVIVKCI